MWWKYPHYDVVMMHEYVIMEVIVIGVFGVLAHAE